MILLDAALFDALASRGCEHAVNNHWLSARISLEVISILFRAIGNKKQSYYAWEVMESVKVLNG